MTSTLSMQRPMSPTTAMFIRENDDTEIGEGNNIIVPPNSTTSMASHSRRMRLSGNVNGNTNINGTIKGSGNGTINGNGNSRSPTSSNISKNWNTANTNTGSKSNVGASKIYPNSITKTYQNRRYGNENDDVGNGNGNKGTGSNVNVNANANTNHGNGNSNSNSDTNSRRNGGLSKESNGSSVANLMKVFEMSNQKPYSKRQHYQHPQPQPKQYSPRQSKSQSQSQLQFKSKSQSNNPPSYLKEGKQKYRPNSNNILLEKEIPSQSKSKLEQDKQQFRGSSLLSSTSSTSTSTSKPQATSMSTSMSMPCPISPPRCAKRVTKYSKFDDIDKSIHISSASTSNKYNTNSSTTNISTSNHNTTTATNGDKKVFMKVKENPNKKQFDKHIGAVSAAVHDTNTRKYENGNVESRSNGNNSNNNSNNSNNNTIHRIREKYQEDKEKNNMTTNSTTGTSENSGSSSIANNDTYTNNSNINSDSSSTRSPAYQKYKKRNSEEHSMTRLKSHSLQTQTQAQTSPLQCEQHQQQHQQQLTQKLPPPPSQLSMDEQPMDEQRLESNDATTPTNNGLSERRRKMAMAKKHARSSTMTTPTTSNSSPSTATTAIISNGFGISNSISISNGINNSTSDKSSNADDSSKNALGTSKDNNPSFDCKAPVPVQSSTLETKHELEKQSPSNVVKSKQQDQGSLSSNNNVVKTDFFASFPESPLRTTETINLTNISKKGTKGMKDAPKRPKSLSMNINQDTYDNNYHSTPTITAESNDTSLTSIDHDSCSTSKFPSSPSRRRRFEIVKESMKHRRHHQNQQMMGGMDKEGSIVSNDGSVRSTMSTASSLLMKLDKNNRSGNGGGNGNSTTQTLSTASLSTSTFETFESDINLFQHRQQQQSSNRMKPIEKFEETPPSPASPIKSGSSEMHWDIDEFTPSKSKKSPKSKFNLDKKKNSPSVSVRSSRSSQTRRRHGDNDLLLQDDNDGNPKLSNYQITSVSENYNSPGRSSEKPQYFAPPNIPQNNNTWDDDDETQFNSVTENTDRRKVTHIDTINLPIHPLQSNTMSTKSDKSTSYFSAGFGGNSRRVIDVPKINGSNTNDGTIIDDDESYSGSVGNRSWTGRMRARQANHSNVGLSMDKQFSTRFESPSKRQSVYSMEDKTEVSHFSASQLLTRDLGSAPGCADATKGVEEMKKFAKEDPTTTAVGVGVCGALCGALAFGASGFVLAAGAVGACYGVSQLPEEKRKKIKEKASTTVDKITSQTVVASDYMSNNCGTACGTIQTPVKQANGENDTIMSRSLGVSITPKADAGDLMKNLSPQNETITGGPIGISPGLAGRGNQHESIQQDTNVLLSQASKRKFNRLAPACCRMGRITPVNQIHSLDPSLHSRAWLDVMASAWTSREEKSEAMEEILLLAKDKTRARMLLEEGILDSLMYILRAFFQSYTEKLSQSGKHIIPLEKYMGDPNFFHSKLAANCCVALAKAHHAGTTEFVDSPYNGGLTLPLSRQVAQLLCEMPHHMAVKVPGAAEGEKKEVFKLTTEMTIQIAEDLAASITALTAGKIEVNVHGE